MTVGKLNSIQKIKQKQTNLTNKQTNKQTKKHQQQQNTLPFFLVAAILFFIG